MKRRRNVSAILVIALLAALVATASAAPPANDDFDDALPILEGVEQRADVRDGGVEETEDVCGESPTAYWKFTAPAAGDYIAYATGSNYDTEVSLSAALDDEIGECNDDSNSGYDAVEAPHEMDTDDMVWIQLGAYDVDARGSGGVGIALANDVDDHFADRSAVTFRAGAPSAVRGFVFDGTEGVQGGEPVACGDGTFASTAWMSFTPPTSGAWMFDLRSDDDLSYAIHRGTTLGGLTPITCSVEDGRNAIVADLTAGVPIAIQINDDDGEGADGVMRIEDANAIRGMSQLVDDTGDGSDTQSGESSAVALLDDGRPAIAHRMYDESDTLHTVTYSERGTDGTWTNTVVDSWTGADSGGTSVDLAILPDGRPVFAYFHALDETLRFAERAANGTWSTVLVDDDGSGAADTVGEALALKILANGHPAIAYSSNGPAGTELRFAERSGTGTWSDVTVDDDGDGTSADVGDELDLIVFEGKPAIAYADQDNDEQRFARRSSGTWSDSLALGSYALGTDGEATGADGRPGLAIDPGGDLVMAIQDDENGHTRYGTFDGSSWDFEEILTDRLMAELGWSETARPLFDRAGRPIVIWHDGNYGGHVGVSVYDDGWYEEISVPYLINPLSPSVDGENEMFADQIDAVTMPDGRLAWTSVDNSSGDLFWVEDMRRVCPDAATPFTDVSASSFAAAHVKCIYGLGVTTGTSPTLYSPDDHVSREQMASFLARLYRELTGEDCTGGAHPFTDVPASSFAYDDIACIFGLGITTGTGPTTYDPYAGVTREQMASFLARLYRLVTDPTCSGGAHPFTDVAADSFAKNDVPCIYRLGVTTGTSPTLYSPADWVTREQMAAFLGRIWLTPAMFPA